MVLRLETKSLTVQLDPEQGGRIRSIRTQASSHDWIFFDASRAPQGIPPGASYDDVWCGGFEELFPNDAPGSFDGRLLPDHGELWNSSMEITDRAANRVTLRRECSTVPAMFEKRVQLDESRTAFDIEYRITNRSADHLRFLFKLHPALALAEGDRLLLPGGTVTPVDPDFGSHLGGGRGQWPLVLGRAGEMLDLSLVQPQAARSREFVYVSQLVEGWCGLERKATGERILFRFPLSVFPFCWLFITYGGWRDYYTVVLEPCSNMPKDLGEAARAGTCAVLRPGASLVCTVNVSVEMGTPT